MHRIKWTSKVTGVVFYSQPNSDLNLVSLWQNAGAKPYLDSEIEQVTDQTPTEIDLDLREKLEHLSPAELLELLAKFS